MLLAFSQQMAFRGQEQNGPPNNFGKRGLGQGALAAAQDDKRIRCRPSNTISSRAGQACLEKE